MFWQHWVGLECASMTEGRTLWPFYDLLVAYKHFRKTVRVYSDIGDVTLVLHSSILLINTTEVMKQRHWFYPQQRSWVTPPLSQTTCRAAEHCVTRACSNNSSNVLMLFVIMIQLVMIILHGNAWLPVNVYIFFSNIFGGHFEHIICYNCCLCFIDGKTLHEKLQNIT